MPKRPPELPTTSSKSSKKNKHSPVGPSGRGMLFFGYLFSDRRPSGSCAQATTASPSELCLRGLFLFFVQIFILIQLIFRQLAAFDAG